MSYKPYNLCKRKYFFIKTYSCREVFDYCTRIQMLSDKVIKIKNALVEKHDSEKYARNLYDDAHEDMIKMIRTEPYKKNKCNTLKHIDENEYEMQMNYLAPKYVPLTFAQKFKESETVRCTIDYIYNSTELFVLNDLSLKRLNGVDTNLINELEPLKQYPDIVRIVNALQFLMQNLYKYRNKFLDQLKQDKKYLNANNRIAKCIMLKRFRKTVHEIKRSIYSNSEQNQLT